MNKVIIKNLNLLKDNLAILRDSECFAFDAEFIRRDTFYPKACLLQFSSGEQQFIIDCIEFLDAGLWKEAKDEIRDFFLNTNAVSVIHAADQDAELLCHDFSLPKYLFDTQLAARFIGFSSTPSYADVVQAYCGVKLEKVLQFSKWDERPLSERHIDYAISDVSYLKLIYPKILDHLIKLDRINWFLEESAFRRKAYLSEKSDVISEIMKFANKGYSHDRILLAYCLFLAREVLAKRYDINKNMLLHINAIISFILSQSDDIESMPIVLDYKKEFLEHVKSMYSLKSSFESDVIAEIEKHNGIRYKKDKQFFRIKSILSRVSQDLSISEEFIATNKDISKFIAGMPSKVMKGWRYQVFGSKL